ncbi:MAG TPA: thioesterase family protein [Salinimicrobium sp.]|nr:thioesterase family protein [Salinimicrobium sp.]
MKKYISFIKVRYSETDQMGVVHHGNYPQYLEVARIEWLDSLGISYKSMEKNGTMLPVYEMNFKFKKSAFFDDELKIETILKKMPTASIEFEYNIYNQKDELLCTASTILVFVNKENMRPMKCPDYVLEKLKE